MVITKYQISQLFRRIDKTMVPNNIINSLNSVGYIFKTQIFLKMENMQSMQYLVVKLILVNNKLSWYNLVIVVSGKIIVIVFCNASDLKLLNILIIKISVSKFWLVNWLRLQTQPVQVFKWYSHPRSFFDHDCWIPIWFMFTWQKHIDSVLSHGKQCLG